jgi:RNA polymerase sigma-70 factor, ECF subfamily
MDTHNIRSQFERAYDELADPIFRHCYFRLSNRERALEVTQEVFMKTWDYIREGNTIDNFRAFLYKVANNLIINEYRKKTAVSLDALSDEKHFEVPEDTHTSVADVVEGKRIVTKLDELEPQYKDVIYLRYLDSFSVKEIAQLLNESENTISVRLHRAIKKLRELYA